MSIASRITSMENNIRNAYHGLDSIGIDTTNTNKNIENISALLDDFYDSLPKVSGTGAIISLSPTKVGKIKSTIIGNTIQDGTPAPDNPVEIQTVTGLQNVNVCGKNLFNNNGTMYQSTSATVETINTGIRATILRTGDNRYGKVVIANSNELLGKTVTLSANFNSSASNTGRIALYQISSTGATISGIGMLGDTGSTTLTIPSEYSTDAVALALLFYANTSGTSEVNDYVDYTNVQLEIGSTATEYEEYIGQDYKINLGKNLINNIETTQTINGITYTVNDDGSVLVDGTATALTILNIIGNNTFTLPAGKYTISGCPSGGSNSTYRLDINDGARTEFRDYGNSSTFTLTSNILIRNMRIRIASGATIDNLLFKPMLEKGSQATSYSPYFTPIELCKIGDYKDGIKQSTGKNLLDTQYFQNGSINTSGVDVSSNTNARCSNYISVSPNTKYTISANTTLYDLRLNEYDNGKNNIQRKNQTNTNQLTITTSSNCYYVRWSFNYDNSTTTTQEIINSLNLQLEQNSQATSFEPYLPKGTWYIEKQISKVVLNGSESGWSYNNEIQVFVISNLVEYLRTGFIPYSNYYKGQSVTQYRQMQDGYISFLQSTTNNRLIIKNTNIITVEDLKSWLSTNNVIVYYLLETPTYTEINNEELIEQLDTWEYAKSMDGQTNISVEGDLPMILDVSVLKGE